MLTPEWECADGTTVRLRLMSTSHILNARQYLLTGTGPYGPMLRPGCSGFSNLEWIRLFEAELLLRSKHPSTK
jgi:hypothetical protein